MKETPLLFSGDMVRAERSGRKTQTRRIVKPCKDLNLGCPLAPNEIAGEINAGDYTNSPYGGPGDRLWVRESWRVARQHDAKKPRDLNFDRGMTIMYDAGGSRAHDGTGRYVNDDNYPPSLPDWAGKLRPSIFLPRVACRTVLEITSVRIDLLQDITDDDALKEGVDRTNTSIPGYARERFSRLWDSLNAARGFGWDTNPWVWRIEFKRADDVTMQDAA